MITIYISKGNSTVSFYLESWINGNYRFKGFNGYSVRKAISLFRKQYGIRYKHCLIIDMRGE